MIISAEETKSPPRFRDEGSQCISVPENSNVTLSVELYEFTNEIEISW